MTLLYTHPLFQQHQTGAHPERPLRLAAIEARLAETGGVGKLALVEVQNGDAAPSYVAGTSNFYAVTRYNWSSYYALAVIELGEAVSREITRGSR